MAGAGDLARLPLSVASGAFAAVTALPRLVVALETLGEARPAIDRLATAVEEAQEPLARLSDVGEALEQLAGASASLEQIAQASASLEQIAGARPAIDEIAAAQEAIERIAAATEYLPRLADSAEGLGDLPDRLNEVARHLDATSAQLEPLVRDTGQIAEAVAPLQGASERVGRLMDRLPERRSRS